MDPTTTPSPSAKPLPDLVNSSALAAASPYWLHRAFLGLTGNGGRTRANEELRRFNSNMSYFAFTILWFSAIYLLAAPEDKTDQPNQALALARKLLIYVGCGSVLITFFPVFSSRCAADAEDFRQHAGSAAQPIDLILLNPLLGYLPIL